MIYIYIYILVLHFAMFHFHLTFSLFHFVTLNGSSIRNPYFIRLKLPLFYGTHSFNQHVPFLKFLFPHLFFHSFPFRNILYSSSHPTLTVNQSSSSNAPTSLITTSCWRYLFPATNHNHLTNCKPILIWL